MADQSVPEDWADALAREILDDLAARAPFEDRVALVAARLRLLKHSGIGEGLRQAAEAITTTRGAINAK